MSGPGNILIKVGAETAGAIAGLNKVNKSLGDTMSTSEKFGAGIRKAALPAAAALGALGVAAFSATKAALEDAAAQDKLAGVLERTTGATEAQVKATEAWITNLSLASGVADDELRPALAKLASATGSIADGQAQLATALDISAASGKNLTATSQALAKANDGSLGALYKLVPGLKAATDGSKDMTVVMDELARLTGGAMSDSANTAEGQMRRLDVQMAELKETLGASLIPVVEALLPILRSMGNLAAQNTTVIKILVGVVAGLSAGILIANAAMKLYAAAQIAIKAATVAWTAMQWLLNAALTANPIGLVVVAVGLLVAAFVLAYTKSDRFRSIINQLWAVLKYTTPLTLVIAYFDQIADAIGRAVSAVQSLISWLGRIRVPSINLPGPFSSSSSVSPSTFSSSSRAASSSGITVNVYGAIDPEGTARSIEKVLRGHYRRQGLL